jgi:beta-hydroxylase
MVDHAGYILHIAQLLAPKYLIVAVFLAATLYVHFRGKVRRPILRQIGDHNTLVAPYNLFMYWFSAIPAKPILNVNDFPELTTLRDNWQVIRDEALLLLSRGQIGAATGHNDFGFNSFYKAGWKRFYLKWYDSPLPSALSSCPKTVALVESIPSVHAAMFAVLPPGARLNPHRDPFAGSLRYHLGLSTPNDDKCRIYIDGQMYSWRDGHDVVFDETYLHSAANDTQQTRVILFCDIERPLRTRIVRAINRFISNTLVRAASTQNVPTEQIGWLNRIYALGGKTGDWLGDIKKKNRTAFRLGKYALIAAAVYLIYFAW